MPTINAIGYGGIVDIMAITEAVSTFANSCPKCSMYENSTETAVVCDNSYGDMTTLQSVPTIVNALALRALELWRDGRRARLSITDEKIAVVSG